VKVAMLGPLPGEGAFAGGVDAVVAALVDGLAARPEIELHVVTAVPGLKAATTEQRCAPASDGCGYLLHCVPHPRGDRLLWHLPVVRPLAAALAKIDPDIVHAHMAGPYAGAALQSGRPAAITLHGVVFREAALALAHSSAAARLRWRLDALYERWVVRRARDLIAISPYVAQEYRPLTRARFHAIENPVADRFFDVPDAAERPASPSLLCVARVIPRKDILTLLAAFAGIRAAIPDATLEIAGQADADPAYTAACRSAIERLELGGSIRFLGSQGGDDLAACYARADVVLLTSRQETAPVVVAEAMAAGRPVVATAVGGVPFMVTDGQTGLLAQPGDARGLADAAGALLRDPAQRLAFGRAARAQAERRFRLNAVVEQTVTLYRDLVGMR
jgi:glycosyltransferase involved in cell wall biosynthesis